MDQVIKGRVWKFGHNVDTDVITPGRYLSMPLEQLKAHVFEPANPDFAKKAGRGDLVVAGKNFGCGSSREQAVTALVTLGLGGVIAESFGRIFFRNAIAHGFPIMILDNAPEYFEEGDEAELDIEKATVKNITQGKMLQTAPLSRDLLENIQNGGILALLKAKLQSRQAGGLTR